MTMLTPLVIEVNPPVLVPSVVSPPVPSGPGDAVAFITNGSIVNGSELIINDLTDEYIRYRVTFAGCRCNNITDARLVATMLNGAPAGGYAYRKQMSSYGAGGTTTQETSTSNWAYLSDVASTGNATIAGTIDILGAMHSVPTIILCRTTGMSNNWAFKLLDIMSIAGDASTSSTLRIVVNDGASTEGLMDMKYTVYGYKV